VADAAFVVDFENQLVEFEALLAAYRIVAVCGTPPVDMTEPVLGFQAAAEDSRSDRGFVVLAGVVEKRKCDPGRLAAGLAGSAAGLVASHEG
jgi:hypothetical protein